MWTEREGLLLRLEDEGARAGYGECAPIPAFGTETVDEAEAACRELGDDVDDERLNAVPRNLGCLRNAIANARMALPHESDEVADQTKAKVPAVESAKRPAYLAVAALLPAGRPALAQVAPKAEIGFRVFKWKVGVADAADELALLDDLCAALPGGAKLRLDANGAWDRRRAERWLERCAERPIEFVEQPIAADHRGAEDLLFGLANDHPTPIALDESLVRDAEVEKWLGLGWPGFFVLKPSLIADMPTVTQQLAKAKARVVFSSALETAVGARAALEAAFDWPGDRHAIGFGVWPLFADRRFDGPGGAPMIRVEDVERMNPEEVWKALG